jgi:hypothetical protein
MGHEEHEAVTKRTKAFVRLSLLFISLLCALRAFVVINTGFRRREASATFSNKR